MIWWIWRCGAIAIVVCSLFSPVCVTDIQRVLFAAKSSTIHFRSNPPTHPPMLVNSRSVSRCARPLCPTALLKGLRRTRRDRNCDNDFSRQRRTNNTKGLAPRRRREFFVRCGSHRQRIHRERLLPDAECKWPWLPLIHYRHFHGHPCFPNAVPLSLGG